MAPRDVLTQLLGKYSLEGGFEVPGPAVPVGAP